jgi:hypothetical protein
MSIAHILNRKTPAEAKDGGCFSLPWDAIPFNAEVS